MIKGYGEVSLLDLILVALLWISFVMMTIKKGSVLFGWFLVDVMGTVALLAKRKK